MNLDGTTPPAAQAAPSADQVQAPDTARTENATQQEYPSRVQLHQTNLSRSRRLQLSTGTQREDGVGLQERHQAKPEDRNNVTSRFANQARPAKQGVPSDGAGSKRSIPTAAKGDANPPDLTEAMKDADRAPSALRPEKSVPHGQFRLAVLPATLSQTPDLARESHVTASTAHQITRSPQPDYTTIAAEISPIPTEVGVPPDERSTARPAVSSRSMQIAPNVDTGEFNQLPSKRSLNSPWRGTDVSAGLPSVAKNGEPIPHGEKQTITGHVGHILGGFSLYRHATKKETKPENGVSTAEGRPLNQDIYPIRPVTYHRKCRRPDGCVLKAGDTSFCDRCVTPDL